MKKESNILSECICLSIFLTIDLPNHDHYLDFINNLDNINTSRYFLEICYLESADKLLKKQ